MNQEEVVSNPNFVAHLILTQVVSYARKLAVSKQNPFVICMDSSPSWRHDYYIKNCSQFDDLKEMKYKGNRKTDDVLPWDKIKEISTEICMALQAYSDFYVLKIDKCEADDIIAVLAEKFGDSDVWVVSSDKDFVQLQTENVKIFDPLKQTFKPEQNIDLFKKIHTMIGDKTDNIPAIRSRLGEKTALKIVKDLDELLASDPILRARYKFNADLILFENIPSEIKTIILTEFNNQTFSFNNMNLMKTFMKYGLSKHAEDIYSFKLSETASKTKTTKFFDEIKNDSEKSESNLEDFFS
jgi:5'-3' exonuclease